MGLVSAFVWAVLTRRHFRITWETPYPLRTVLRPATPALPWDRNDYQNESFQELRLIDRVGSLRDYFRSADLLAEAEENILIAANQSFLTWLLDNRSLRACVDDDDFQEPHLVFRQALHALFRPAPDLFDAWPDQARALNKRNSIGLQIRTLWNWQDGGGPLTTDELACFFRCAELLLQGTDEDVVFVTSDDRSIFDRTRKRFPDVEVAALDLPILHVDRSSWSALDDYRATFANLYFVAACRHLVISNWSNFGRIAAFLSGQRPWITRKSMTCPLYPIVREPFRQAALSELLSKDEPPALTTQDGAILSYKETQPCGEPSAY
jgi:hypothetical protein